MKNNLKALAFAVGGLTLATPALALNNYITLPLSTSTPVQITGAPIGVDPNGNNIYPTPDNGRFTTFAGAVSGYTQVATRSVNITARNQIGNTFGQTVTIGSIQERVYRQGTSTNFIFASKLNLTNIDWDTLTPGVQTFEVNDIQRAGFLNRGASVAFFMSGNSDETLWQAARTNVGLNWVAGDPANPGNPLNYIDFRTDLNGGIDDDGSSKNNSAWSFIKVQASGFAVQNSVYRLWEGGEEGQKHWASNLISGYAPTGTVFATPPVPEPSEYAMMIAGLGMLAFVVRRRQQT